MFQKVIEKIELVWKMPGIVMFKPPDNVFSPVIIPFNVTLFLVLP